MKKRTVIYTAIFGGYDALNDFRFTPNDQCDFYCFTDDVHTKSDRWKIIYSPCPAWMAPLKNRHYKMLPHLYFPNHKRSLYIDGNISLKRDPSSLIDKVLNDSDIAIPVHPKRNCIYDEIQVCFENGLITPQERDYRHKLLCKQRYGRQLGLFENNIIFRNHHEQRLIRLMQSWWKDFQIYCSRDQISFAFLAWRHNIPVSPVRCGPRITNDYFQLNTHRFNNHFIGRLKSVYFRRPFDIHRRKSPDPIAVMARNYMKAGKK